MREKIIDATVEEFKQNGLKFTMNDLAKRLGISKKTIYTVFESKQAVLVAITGKAMLFNPRTDNTFKLFLIILLMDFSTVNSSF